MINDILSKRSWIADRIQSRIERNMYLEKIPGEREIAREFGVNVKTANRAVQTLVERGVLERRPGRGTFIRAKQPRRTQTRLAFAFFKFAIQSPDPLFVDLFAGANAQAKQAGCSFALTMARQTPPPEGLSRDQQKVWIENNFLQEVAADRPEGILYAGLNRPDVIDRLQAIAPVLQVATFTGRPGERYVRRDTASGVSAAYERLAQSGSRRIAFATYADDIATDLIRREKAGGYREAARAHGADYTRIIGVPGYGQAGKTLLKVLGSEDLLPTAIIAAESTIGLATLRVAARLGIRVPGNLALISFDDACLGQATIPRMSGIRVFDAELGTRAVTELVALLEGNRPDALEVKLPALLSVRESCGTQRLAVGREDSDE